MTSPTIPPGTRVGDLLAGGECPRCGAAYDRLQEYCLECGLRLPTEPTTADALGAATGRPSAWQAGDWLWPVLFTLVIAVLTAAAALALAASRDDDGPRLVVATSPQIPTLTGAQPQAPATTAPTASLPPEPEPVEPQAPPPPPAGPRPLITWPAGRNGFTVVLSSVPAGSRAAALQKARQARSAGLEEVGVLDSSRYPSLHSGYLVVFSGVHPTLAAAQAASAEAHDRGYADAYAAQVAR